MTIADRIAARTMPKQSTPKQSTTEDHTMTMNATTTDRLVPTRDVERRLGLPAGSLTQRAYPAIRVVTLWDRTTTAISEADAARLLDGQATTLEANRQRKADEAARRAREDQLFEDDRERRFWGAMASIMEHWPLARERPLEVTADAYACIDSEDAYQAIIKQWGKPSASAITYLTGMKEGRPSWLK